MCSTKPVRLIYLYLHRFYLLILREANLSKQRTRMLFDFAKSSIGVSAIATTDNMLLPVRCRCNFCEILFPLNLIHEHRGVV